GVSNTTVFGLGQSIKITGTVKEGAIAFGGDVIVEGSVNGDVAAIGGSVIQREGSRIGGDVIVLGGIYHHGKAAPGRDPQSVTIMYAGYEYELRHVMREPFSLLHPRLIPAFLGMRLLVLVATLFGRVVIFVATGRWLQRRFLPRVRSESIMLLLGVTFWVALASLPYIWPIVIAGLLVVSLGLALTARYRIGWKRPSSL